MNKALYYRSFSQSVTYPRNKLKYKNEFIPKKSNSIFNYNYREITSSRNDSFKFKLNTFNDPLGINEYYFRSSNFNSINKISYNNDYKKKIKVENDIFLQKYKNFHNLKKFNSSNLSPQKEIINNFNLTQYNKNLFKSVRLKPNNTELKIINTEIIDEQKKEIEQLKQDNKNLYNKFQNLYEELQNTAQSSNNKDELSYNKNSVHKFVDIQDLEDEDNSDNKIEVNQPTERITSENNIFESNDKIKLKKLDSKKNNKIYINLNIPSKPKEYKSSIKPYMRNSITPKYNCIDKPYINNFILFNKEEEDNNNLTQRFSLNKNDNNNKKKKENKMLKIIELQCKVLELNKKIKELQISNQ